MEKQPPLEQRLDAHVALEEAQHNFQMSAGRAKFDAARVMDQAQKDYDRADVSGRADALRWNRQVGLVADYRDIIAKQEENPYYNRTEAEDAVFARYDEQEASNIKHGLGSLEELVSDDDVRYFRMQEEDSAEAEAPVAEEPKSETLNNKENLEEKLARLAVAATEMEIKLEHAVKKRNEVLALADKSGVKTHDIVSPQSTPKAPEAKPEPKRVARVKLNGVEIGSFPVSDTVKSPSSESKPADVEPRTEVVDAEPVTDQSPAAETEPKTEVVDAVIATEQQAVAPRVRRTKQSYEDEIRKRFADLIKKDELAAPDGFKLRRNALKILERTPIDTKIDESSLFVRKGLKRFTRRKADIAEIMEARKATAQRQIEELREERKRFN